MHYWGRIITQRVNHAVWEEMPTGEQIYAFLRRALSDVPDGLPLRGPPRYDEGEWSYRADISGDLGLFRGSELIGYKIRVYECVFHGGLLRAKTE